MQDFLQVHPKTSNPDEKHLKITLVTHRKMPKTTRKLRKIVFSRQFHGFSLFYGNIFTDCVEVWHPALILAIDDIIHVINIPKSGIKSGFRDILSGLIHGLSCLWLATECELWEL